MKEYKQILFDEIPLVREKSLQYVNGEITKPEYKGFSGGFGVYAQRDKQTFMIRLRISSGVVALSQLQVICELAQRCGLKGIHLTTRQAIQLHSLTAEQVCMVMEECLKHDIYTRGGGGNYPRNVALSPLSGFMEEDVFDVTPYAVLVDNHFIRQMTSYHLPRKLKVSFASSEADHSHCTVQDLGFMAVREDGKKRFKVYLGGGLGNNPKTAFCLEETISPTEILYYVDAMVEFFKTYGDYENKHKARIRYIAERLGEAVFKEKYLEIVTRLKQSDDCLVNISEPVCSKAGKEKTIEDETIICQKQKGLYGVEIHPYGGQLRLTDLKKLIQCLEHVETPEIRLAMTEGLFILNLNGGELEAVLALSKSISQNTMIEKGVSCIGVPVCQMGIQDSQKVLVDIIQYFKAQQATRKMMNILPGLHISGCTNSCGVHQIGAVGLAGKMKRVDGQPVDAFTLFLGGRCQAGKTELGENKGDFGAARLPEMIYRLAEATLSSGQEFYQFINDDSKSVEAILSSYRI